MDFASLLGYKPTIFLVTHDRERFKKADQIVFVSKSMRGVADTGTHDEMMERGGPYADWFNGIKDGQMRSPFPNLSEPVKVDPQMSFSYPEPFPESSQSRE